MLIPDGRIKYKLVNNLRNAGFVQILESNIQDFFQTSRLASSLSIETLKRTQEQSFFNDALQM